MTSTKALKIAIIHPDLGIGGAERLVVDAASGLTAKGHKVVIYTSHHDEEHCFEETKDGTLEVRVRGNTIIPRTFSGSFYVVCAILRQLHLTLSMIFSDKDKFDVIFMDQLSANIPLLKLAGAKVLFYCHFPDKLLTQRKTTAKSLYRIPIDIIEELTTGMANCLVVNSKFTSNIFCESFTTIKKMPQILYPGIRFEAYDRKVNTDDESVKILETSKKVILSINRFERKKNIVLAIRAFARLQEKCLISSEKFRNMRLIIAGGYDYRIQENVAHHLELSEVALQLGLEVYNIMPDSISAPPESAQVVFLCSFNDTQRTYLLSKALCLLYTPSNEHFGIVPIEAMYTRLPVIACDSGGPKETIINGETGVLCFPNPAAFAEAIASFVNGDYDREAMGNKGRSHVQKSFSLDTFINSLEDLLIKLASDNSKNTQFPQFPIQFPLILFSTLITLSLILYGLIY
ncbi:1566_t:CDS:2 [Diversispora eburnea]|uniref:Alpha-1,3/1,6-mannosyltransferase ALG2 n=1 Tax=Diversispora eburnea TaxID=1213867 RepID=A0A9N8UXF2_9GLOM|nr:1566_t:CDS:2 [Diversispora eburnea]